MIANREHDPECECDICRYIAVKYEKLVARERHLFDVYKALGLEFGQDIFAAIKFIGGPPPWRCPCGEDCEVVDYPTGVRSCGNVKP